MFRGFRHGILRSVCLTVLALGPAAGAGAQEKSVATDKAALEALYDATGGANWSTKTNWGSDESLSKWFGVTTNASGRVTGVSLVLNNLVGALPAALGNLSELRSLDLQWNGLTGAIPSALGDLSSLQVLLLNQNALTGSIPSSLSKPSGLLSLGLANNDLTGSIPGTLGSLANLQYLSLGGNSLSGTFPAALATAASLKELGLGFNAGLTGSLPAGFANLTDLADVNIHGTQVCVPSDAAFQAWASRIGLDSSGRVCGAAPSASPVIDVAVFYTPAARRAAGGTSQMEAKIDLWVAEANQAYTDGGVRQRIALVAREETPYVESEDSLTDLQRLADPDDGYLDGVHPVRDIVGADLVHLVVGAATVTGLAYSAPRADEAFSLVYQGVDGDVFAHELGHSMGLSHDRHAQCADGFSCTWTGHYPYGFGYVNQKAFEAGAPASRRWITIMAYPDQCRDQGSFSCTRLLRFSDPDQSHGGDALGVSGERDAAGLSGPADAARALDDAVYSVAGFRGKVARDAGHAPRAAGSLPNLALTVGGAAVEVDVSNAFSDPDDDSLTYGALSSVGAVATVQVSAARVTVTPVARGRTTITVTATDAGGSNNVAWQQFVALVDVANVTDYDGDDDGLIEIGTLAQLNAVRFDLNGDGDPVSAGAAAYKAAFPGAAIAMGCGGGSCSGYELAADLDLDTNGSGAPDAGDAYWNGGAGWLPIGPGLTSQFAATFQGNGRTIGNLYVKRTGDAGLFGRIGSTAAIRRLGLVDVDVTGQNAGGLAGVNSGTVADSHASGRVTGTAFAGGLVGVSAGSVVGSRAACRVSVPSSGGFSSGGLVGWNTGTIAASYAASRTTGIAGGLAGHNSGAIKASYATGLVEAGSGGGGLVAKNAAQGSSIVASYTIARVTGGAARLVGGLMGEGLPSGGDDVTDSYWDTGKTGQRRGVAGSGRTTAQLQARTGYSGIFADWNLDLDGDGTADDPWDFGAANQYPALKANHDGAGAATWEEFGHQVRSGPVLTVVGGARRAALSWTAVDTSHWTPAPAVAYRVIRSRGTTVSTVAESVNGVRYVDTAVPIGTHRYEIVALVDGWEAARSAVVEAEVIENRPPRGLRDLADRTLRVGGSTIVDVAGDFRDDDGDALTYTATSSAPSVASATVSGASVTVRALSTGQAVVSVSATDVAGSNTAATSTIDVTVLAPRGVTISEDALTIDEGSTGSYTVVLNAAPTGTVTVTPAVPANTDVTVDPASLDFTAGNWDQAQTVSVGAARDADTASDASVTIGHRVSGADYGAVQASPVRVTIVETDSATLSVQAAEAAENEGALTFEVTLSRSSASEITVDYATSDGPGPAGARAGADYTAASGTLTFPAGSTAARQIAVQITDDADDEEEEETFRLTLRNPRHASLAGGGSTLRVTGTIEDDDDPEVEASFGSAGHDVTEGTAVTVSVHLDRDPERELEIVLERTHRGGAEEADYSGVPGSVAFGPGVRTQEFLFSATDDSADDDGESVVLSFGVLPPRVTGAGETTLAIVDNDESRGGPGGGGGGGGAPSPGDDDGDGGGAPGGGGGGGPLRAAIVTDAACEGTFCRALTGVPVSFRDASGGAARSRLWDFGDGRRSRSASLSHSWSSPGFYEASLAVSDGAVESAASLTFLVEASEPAGTCAAHEATRCLQDSRYAVSVEWRTAGGESGAAGVIRSGTNDAGLFAFFDPANWEVLVKVLDGCAVNGRRWVFAASTTDLGYLIRVTDTATGAVREYRNEPGTPAPAITDVTAFGEGCER